MFYFVFFLLFGLNELIYNAVAKHVAEGILQEEYSYLWDKNKADRRGKRPLLACGKGFLLVSLLFSLLSFPSL